MTNNCEIIGCGQEGFEHIELVLDVPTVWGGNTTKVKVFVCPSCRNKIWDPNAYIGQSRAQVKGVDRLEQGDMIIPGAFTLQENVPFKNGMSGEVLGKCTVKPNGTIDIVLNYEGTKLFTEEPTFHSIYRDMDDATEDASETND